MQSAQRRIAHGLHALANTVKVSLRLLAEAPVAGRQNDAASVDATGL